MPHDDGGGTGVPQHLGRQVAGEGAGRLGVAVLRADPHRATRHGGRKARKQRGRRAYHDLDPGELARTGNNSGELGRRGLQPVHLPVARNQRAPRRVLHVRYPPFRESGQAVSRAVADGLGAHL